MNERTLAKPESRSVEYIPLGGTDRLKLSVKIVQDLIAVPTRSGKTCSERDAIRFLAMCQAKKLNPFEGDAFLLGYDGKDGPSFSLITAHQTYLKRAEMNPEFDGLLSGIIVDHDGEIKDIEGEFRTDDEKLLGGWAQVNFKTRKTPIKRRVRLARFYRDTQIWRQDPEGMIAKCAESDALRSSFPSMLGGLYSRAEVDLASPPVDLPIPRMIEQPKQESLPPAADPAREDQIPGAEVPPTAKPEAKKSPQEDLAEAIMSRGFSFDDYQKWGKESGNLDADYGGFDELPDAVAKRHLRAIAGLVTGLTNLRKGCDT